MRLIYEILTKRDEQNPCVRVIVKAYNEHSITNMIISEINP